MNLLSGHEGQVRAVAFSPDGAVLASGAADGTVRLWDTASGAARAARAGHTGGVWSVAFSPDGTMLASGAADGTVRLWDAGPGTSSSTSTGTSTDASASAGRGVLVADGEVRSLAFSPDGSALATGGSDRVVRLWDLGDQSLRHALTGHTGWVATVGFSPDGNRLASGGFAVVRVWDVNEVSW